MKKLLLLVSIVFIAACTGSNGPQTLEVVDGRDCTKNFVYEGSLLGGYSYKTNATVKNVTKKDAVNRAVRQLTKDGWQITNSDVNSGTISAAQTVSYGQGKTVPLNVIVEPTGKNVIVTVTYNTSGGVSSPLDAVVNQFCTIIEATGKK